jgi:hypothetical protein
MLFTGINVNRKWKPDATWFWEYANAYVQSTSGRLISSVMMLQEFC